MIRRNFWYCPQDVKETAYITLVRPKLEYACEAWDPHFKKDITSLERVQMKAARLCANNYHPTASVTEMISDLELTNLELKRTMSRLILMPYKMCHGLVDIDVNRYLRPHFSGIRTRSSHNYKFKQDKATKDVYFYSFFPRTIRLRNNLPADLVESSSLGTFKVKLLKYLTY